MLFVDTGVWYAALDRGDVNHGRAVKVLGAGERLVTTDYVLVETWRLAAHRLGFDVAERFWNSLRRGRARLEAVLAVDREAAWAVGRRYRDQRFSLVDRASFAVMERLGVRRVAAFDDDFAVYRLDSDGGEAFELVR
ncbi:MAG: PIN domain-containing protein [Euzebyales bacterium]|jgi:predicted nucleic acid-binding protein|nr:PIN domain-containing protein [Euzebyales bacterium]